MKGYINMQRTVWCFKDGCAEWLQLSAHYKAAFIREIRDMGWRCSTKDGWVCPKHKPASAPGGEG